MKKFPVQLELMRKMVWIEREFFSLFSLENWEADRRLRTSIIAHKACFL